MAIDLPKYWVVLFGVRETGRHHPWGQHFLICHLIRIDPKPEPVPDIEWFPGEPLRAPDNPLLNSSHGRWVLILADQAVSLEPNFVTIEEIVGQEV